MRFSPSLQRAYTDPAKGWLVHLPRPLTAAESMLNPEIRRAISLRSKLLHAHNTFGGTPRFSTGDRSHLALDLVVCQSLTAEDTPVIVCAIVAFGSRT